MSNLCGLDVVQEHYKPNARTIFIFFLINCGLVLSAYTVYIESFLTGDHTNLFKTVSVIGTAFQGYAKALTGLKQTHQFRFIFLEIIGMYETYELRSEAYQTALKNNISLIKKFLFTLFGIVAATSTIVVAVPVFMFIAYNKRLEILPYQIPFIDNQTDFGYYVTSLTHIVVVFFAGFGNFVSDSWLFIFTAQVPLLGSILKCKFDDLDEISTKNPRDVKKTINSLHDILKWHQKYIVFCNAIKSTFYWVIFVQISTEFISIACTIVCMFLGIWPPAPVFVVYLFAIIYSFCSLGNLVEAANYDIMIMIYDSCWYNLTVVEQKMILFMLRESQQAQGITIGGVVPLTLNTALQLTKTIYTFSMMLKEFLME